MDGRFTLSSQKINHWLEIKDSLMVMSHLLDKGFFTRLWPSLTPILPSILGFKKMFSSLWVACLCIVASRNWFLLWMTLISSKIAAIKTNHEDWFSYLVEHKCPQDWVSAVQSSMICDFSCHCPCVGAFLNIKQQLGLKT